MKRILVFTIVIALMGVQAASASSFSVSPLTKISGPSPFAGCTVGATGAPGETLYVDAEEEPWVAVNPANPNNIIAV